MRGLYRVLAVLAMVAALAAGSPTFFSSVTLAQQPTPTLPSPDTSPTPPTPQVPLSQFEREVIELRERINGLSSRLDLALVIFSLIAAVSAYGFFRAESRAKDVHRAFLDPSKQTLDLVNATLQLAREASERALKSVEVNALAERENLDRAAKGILARVPGHDDSALIANQARQSEIIGLAEKVARFESNQLFLPTPIPLTPHCLFIRGIGLHLQQQFEDAVEHWQIPALEDASPDPLKSVAWYWIGIEQDNLGRFSEAEQSFSHAEGAASGAKALELQRIRLQSRFYNKEEVRASTVISPLRELRDKAQAMDHAPEVETRKIKIMITLGNVIHQAGNDCLRDDRVGEAMAYYGEALEVFEQAGGRNEWALLGRAEALYSLGRFDEAYPIYRQPLRRYAIGEYTIKIEPRTRVIGRTIELLCCVRVPDLRDDVAESYHNTLQALGQVDERITAYSLLQRRNVRQGEFRDELDELVRSVQPA